MCLEIHMPDKRVIEGVNKDSRKAIFEGEDVCNPTCLCNFDFSEIMRLIAENLPASKGRQLQMRYDFAGRLYVDGWVDDPEEER